MNRRIKTSILGEILLQNADDQDRRDRGNGRVSDFTAGRTRHGSASFCGWRLCAFRSRADLIRFFWLHYLSLQADCRFWKRLRIRSSPNAVTRRLPSAGRTFRKLSTPSARLLGCSAARRLFFRAASLRPGRSRRCKLGAAMRPIFSMRHCALCGLIWSLG